MELLAVNNLDVYLKTDEELVHAVRNVSFSIEKGQTLAIVGESGSGKSVTSMAIMQLLPKNIVSFGERSSIILKNKTCLLYLKKQCKQFEVIASV